MRARILGFVAAVILAALGALAPAAQAAVPAIDRHACEVGGGTVEYDPATTQWICVGGKHNSEPISRPG